MVRDAVGGEIVWDIIQNTLPHRNARIAELLAEVDPQ